MEDKNRELNVEEMAQGVGGTEEASNEKAFMGGNPAMSSSVREKFNKATDAAKEKAKEAEQAWKTAESQQAPQNNSMPNKCIDW